MTDYEKLYREDAAVCGEPFPELVRFFQTFEKEGANVLDLGCGQGRDALFVARLGHRVVGVDVSPTGIEQLHEAARRERLAIEGVVADVIAYEPDREFDVVILDRIVHMLKADADKRALVGRAMRSTEPEGYVLVADIPSNRQLIVDSFESDSAWQLVKSTKSFSFATHRSRAKQ